MQINSIQSYKYDNKNNISFESLHINKIFKNKAKQLKKQEEINNFCSKIGDTLGTKASDILSLTQGANKQRMSFLNIITEYYNARNFFFDGNLKEDPKSLIEIFKLIEKPSSIHFNIVNKTNAPFEIILELFRNAKDKNSLEFIQKMQHDVLDGSKKSANLIIQMLTSKNQKEYIRNTENYASYIRLNADKEDAVKTLDELIANNKYNRQEYDSKYAIENLYKIKHIQDLFPDKVKYFEQNYSKEGIKFLKSFIHDYLPYNKTLSSEEINDILSIYTTTKPENIDFRIDIIDRLAIDTKSKNSSEIKSIKKLFQKMDDDKSGMEFIYKILGDGIAIDSAKTLNDILNVVPLKKAEIFHKNIARIIKYTDEEERIAALKNEVENPFFITPKYAEQLENSIKYGFSKKESRIMRYAKILENEINKMRYNKIKSTESENMSEVLPAISHETEQMQITSSVLPVAHTETTSETVLPVTQKIEMQKVFKESPQARKLRVQNDVNEIIKQKLGQKTLERQKEEYTNGATVMRLKLLPEIFESIKDTRKLQKASGKRPNIESKDAIKLYSKINGKNRKLVNYMLKQRNEQGERIFNIKDIINKLDKVEKEVVEAKKRNPNFKSSEIKEIYNDEYIYFQYQYGKLKRKKKISV